MSHHEFLLVLATGNRTLQVQYPDWREYATQSGFDPYTRVTPDSLGRTNKKDGLSRFLFVRPVGIEPTTLSLRGICSTS